MALTADGKVFSWGDGEYGQPELETTSEGWLESVCGIYIHKCSVCVSS